jgi:hypothetical protein
VLSRCHRFGHKSANARQAVDKPWVVGFLVTGLSTGGGGQFVLTSFPHQKQKKISHFFKKNFEIFIANF